MNNIDNYDIPNLHIFNSRPKKVFFTICEDMMAALLLYSIILNFSVMILHTNVLLINLLFLLAYALVLTLMRLNIKNHRLVILLSIFLCCIFLTIPFLGYERFLYGFYAILMTINTIKRFDKEGFSFYNKYSFIAAELVLTFNILTAQGLNSSFLKYLSLFLALVSSLLYLAYLSKRDLPTALGETYILNTMVNHGLRKFMIILFSTFLVFASFIVLITNSLTFKANHTLIKSLRIEDHLKAYTLPITNWPTPDEQIKSSVTLRILNKAGVSTKDMNDTGAAFDMFIWIGLLILIILMVRAIYKLIKYIANIEPVKKKIVETKSTFLQEDLKSDLKDILSNFKLNLSNKEKLRRYYKKLIKHYGQKGLNIRRSSTSQELQDGILNLTGNDLENITKLYHKCRYTTYEPTKEDIDLVKKNAKNRAINKDKPLEN